MNWNDADLARSLMGDPPELAPLLDPDDDDYGEDDDFEEDDDDDYGEDDDFEEDDEDEDGELYEDDDDN